jgi:hypothetical protein
MNPPGATNDGAKITAFHFSELRKSPYFAFS